MSASVPGPGGCRHAGIWVAGFEGGAGDVTSAEEFAEFVGTMSPRLRRMAFLLCGDWHTAEDLAQTALAKVFVSWRKIRRQDAVHAYATRTLVNTYLAHRRLKRNGEVLRSWLPEPLAEAPAPETRMMLLDALATLPPRSRAVVVLRYWADLSVEQVADVMGCSTGNVKRLSSRSLDKLRVLLGEAMAESGSSSMAPVKPYEQGGSRHG